MLILELLLLVLLSFGSGLVLWALWRSDRPEDLGKVSEGYRKARGWWKP